jgi:hypothetical protein
MDTFDYAQSTSVDIDHLRRAAARAREIGAIITDAKDQIPHGKFRLCCIEALGSDRRRAQV